LHLLNLLEWVKVYPTIVESVFFLKSNSVLNRGAK